MSGKYLDAREAFATRKLSWTGDRIMACLLSADYVFDEAHSLADIMKHRASEALKLEGRTCIGGGCSARGPTFKQLIERPTSLCVYRDGGPAIVHLDDIAGLPDSTDHEVTLTMPENLFTV